MTSPCTGPNCQGHPHSPECRAHHAKCVQSGIGREEMESKWMPIETAPRIGVIILGRAGNSDLGTCALSVPGGWTDGYESDADYEGMDAGWVDFRYQDFHPGAAQPTHWQPLPEPPGGDDGRG